MVHIFNRSIAATQWRHPNKYYINHESPALPPIAWYCVSA